MSALPQGGCCQPCDPEIPPVQIPGPQGVPGENGTNGINGINSFSTTTDSFVVPAVNDSVTIEVESSDWMIVGQNISIENAGEYSVDAKPDSSHVVAINLGYPGNTAPTTNIPSGQTISPSGKRGAEGASGTTVTLNDISPTTNKGDLLVDNGANNPDASVVALSVGADGTRSKADSTQPTGLIYAKVNLGNADEVTGQTAVGNGGTGASTAANARTNLGLVIGTDIQAFDIFLTSIAALGTAADKILYTTGVNTAAETPITALARTFISRATALLMRSDLGGVLPKYGLLGTIAAVDLNVATSDNAITIESGRYRIDKVMLENASINITTATAGMFTAAGGGGTTLAADQSLASLTASSKFIDLTLDAVVGTDVQTAGTVYFRVGTPQGSAATARVSIFGWKFD